MKTQRKIPFRRSLEGTDKEIKYRILYSEYLKNRISISILVKDRTGLSLHEYLNRRFNRLGYYQYKHQLKNFKHVKINVWDL